MTFEKIKNSNREEGFIKFIVLFLIFAGLLVYFGVDLRGFLDSHPEILQFFHDVGTFAVGIWFEYILPLFMWVWEKIDFIIVPFWEWVVGLIE